MAASRNKRSTDLPGRVAAFFAPRLLHGRRVCVGLSGGRDSVALLHLLADARQQALPLELSALHVHHGLSAHADSWADFCTALCGSLNVPLHLERVSVSGIAKEGVEAAARRARYAVFARCHADWLALAHHRDDQAETLLLNLLRGAGVQGLAAMPEERSLEHTAMRLVRPLLHVPRQEIEAWLTERGHRWIEDDSNGDTRLRRNFLRREVMPLLSRMFPDPGAGLARAAAHQAESAALAETLATADAAAVVDGPTLLLPVFNTLPRPRRINVLRYYLREQGLRMPDARYLAEIVRQLAEASAASASVFRLDGAELHVSRSRLHFRPGAAVHGSEVCDTATVRWAGQASLPWAGGVLRFQFAATGGLSRRRLAEAEVWVRSRRGGERLQVDWKRPRRSLKSLLRESAVPVWERDRLPLLWCGDDLVWVAGIGHDPRYTAASGEEAVLPVWQHLLDSTR